MITPSKNILDLFRHTYGAMSVVEGIALYNITLQAPEGDWYELGSHRGKSSVMITSAAKSNSCLNFLEPDMVDKAVEGAVGANIILSLQKGILNTTFNLIPDYSTNVLSKINKDISLLFVDSGNHGEEIVQSEKPLYENKMVKGGIIIFHDYGEKSQFTAVAKCYNELLASGNYERIEINWQEIFDYVAEHNLEEGNNSWHIYENLPHPPNFVGALKRKTV